MKDSSFCSLLLHFMSIISRESNAVDCIITDVIGGRCAVQFKNGSYYSYHNVSRRALLNLKLQPNMSLGSWVNHNLCLS